VKEIKDDGFSLDELREGGMPEHAVLAVDGRSTMELRAADYTAAVLKKVGFQLYDLVEGEYTASELKDALYDAEQLKEVGFSSGALKVAGFNSRQLHAARYKLREMQEGGFAWQDLVIFLRSTHAELVKAGFQGLDPKHELFLLYRPDREDNDETFPEVSILSPRHSPSHGQRSDVHGKYLNPNEDELLRAMEVTEPYLQVGSVPLQVRQGASLTSKRAGVLHEGTKLRVLDSRIWRGDGTQRVCVRTADDESQILPIGWVTARPGFFSSCKSPWASPSPPKPQSPAVPRKLNLHEMEC